MAACSLLPALSFCTLPIKASLAPYSESYIHSSTCRRRDISVASACIGQNQVLMRKVVERVVLFQMKSELTEEQEKDMLDHLYTLQYRFKGILSMSLGPLLSKNPCSYTHGLFMRFASKDLLFNCAGPSPWQEVADQYIIPYYHDLVISDFEAEVQDEIEPLFRRGEDYERGIEYIMLLKVKDNATPTELEDMIISLNNLPLKIRPALIQLTAGTNFSPQSKGYTHVVVIRLQSEEAMEDFKRHSAYISVVSEKVLPISTNVLSAEFRVDPIGTTIM